MRAKAIAVATSAGILVAAWMAATASGQTMGVPNVGADPTTSATDEKSGAAIAGSTESAAAGESATTAAKATTAAATTAAATKATTAAAASGLKDGTYSGGTVTHKYGTVAVSVTVAGGKITSVAATTTSTSTESPNITSQAVPTLKSRWSPRSPAASPR